MCTTHVTVGVVIERQSILCVHVVAPHVLVGTNDVGILRLGQQPGRVEPHSVAAGACPSNKGADEEKGLYHLGFRAKLPSLRQRITVIVIC